MINEDERFDRLRGLINSCLYGDPVNLQRDYSLLIQMTSEYLATYPTNDEQPDEHRLYWSTIDLALFLDVEDINPTSPMELSKIFIIDKRFREFCVTEVLKDESVCKYKRDIIEKAAELSA